MCFGRSPDQIPACFPGSGKYGILRAKVLGEIITTQFAARFAPSIVECVDLWAEAHGIRNMLPGAIGKFLAKLGGQVHALVLRQDDMALMGAPFEQNRAQVGVFEFRPHGCPR
ncbi:hypothetical protein AO073_15655 [Pseudomonas syringae ICMP 11293]|nr:hypothetical protein AO073_15655 [Pseudomonas syringae ICMP 11293]